MTEGGFNGLDLNLNLEVGALANPTASSAPTYEGGPQRHTRKGKPLPTPIDISEITPEDLSGLALDGPAVKGTGTRLKKIRGSHHFIARAHVAGIKNHEISKLIGYSPCTISALLTQPAMIDLIAEYADKLTDATFDMVGRLNALGMMSLDALEEAFDSEDGVTPDFALKVAQFSSDRIGHGPSSTSTVNNTTRVHFTQQQIIEMREGLVSRRLERGGGVVLIDPAERREAQVNVEQQERLSLQEGSKDTQVPDQRMRLPAEGTAPAAEAQRNSVLGAPVRSEARETPPIDLPYGGEDL